VRIPLLDLTRQHHLIENEVMAAVSHCFQTQQFVLGATVENFEKAFCEAFDCEHAVGMSSGTDAQLAILMALGIGPNDAVITTPYTFFATAGCIQRVGAEVVFVDVLPDTLHMSPARLEAYLRDHCTQADGQLKTPSGKVVKAIIPIHLFGSICRMAEIQKLAREFDLTVIEDAAQAAGAEYPGQNGPVRAGAIAECAYFSFFPTKNLGGAGDGGMAVCRDADFAHKLRLMRNHGMEDRYFHRVVGGNFRLDALQAAVLAVKLPHLENWNAQRRTNANLYREAFTSLGILDHIQLPTEPWADSGLLNHHTYHQYVVRASRRDELKASLAEKGVGHAVYYPVPLHLQECFSPLGYKKGDMPESEKASEDSLALPIFPELTQDEISATAEAIAAFYR